MHYIVNKCRFNERNNHLNYPVPPKLTSEVNIICSYMKYIRLHVPYTLDGIMDTSSLHRVTKK